MFNKIEESSNKNILEVNSVSKKFCKKAGQKRRYAFRDIMSTIFGFETDNKILRKGEFYAVRKVSLKLSCGETLGVIGLNGSGKSTLLKMINGLYVPDDGEIRINGKVGALIELGTGFHSSLSGKENIYLKSAMLGKSKSEIDEIMEDIIEFSELEDFINSPFGTYSSGMKVRLGFAVAVNIKPDLLILDEVLAVGDFKFRQKSLSKLNEIKNRSSTILVSHSMHQIKTFCDRVIVLEKGKIVFDGVPEDAVKYYMSEVETKISKKQKKAKENKSVAFYGNVFNNKTKIKDVTHYWADERLRPIENAESGSEINFVINFKLKYKPVNLILGVPIWNRKGEYITGASTDMNDSKIVPVNDNEYKMILNIPDLILNPGKYVSVVAIHDRAECIYRKKNIDLKVYNYKRNFGYVTIPHRWKVPDLIGNTKQH